jgi:hypothetical protein
MTALKLQKQSLLLESDLNRLAVRADLQYLRSAGTWVGFLQRAEREIAPWGLVLAPLGGVVAALGLRRTVRLFGSVARVLRAARPMIHTGRGLAARPSSRE